jgi:diaminopimelate decarboxylase
MRLCGKCCLSADIFMRATDKIQIMKMDVGDLWEGNDE